MASLVELASIQASALTGSGFFMVLGRPCAGEMVEMADIIWSCDRALAGTAHQVNRKTRCPS